MRRGSLCTGIAGLELLLPGTPAWHAEVDPSCCRLLEERFPSVPNLGDIRTVDWGGVEPVDLLVAGPPCQPISQAGQRKGPDDARWLWDDVWRAVRALRPSFLFLENPPGVFRWFGDVLRGLAQIGGYEARWDVFRAADVGAPHRRARVFLFAADTDRRRHNGRAQEPGGARSGELLLPGVVKTFLPTPTAREGRPRVGRVLPEMARKRMDSGRRNLDDAAALLPTPTARDHKGHNPNKRVGTTDRPGAVTSPAVRRWETLFRPAPAPLDDGGRLSPEFVTWMMGLPEGWTEGLKRTQALRALGNAVVPQVAALAWSTLSACDGALDCRDEVRPPRLRVG